MKKRLVSALLAAVLLFSMMPVQKASAMSVSDIKNQISNTYSVACSKAGVSSFNGYCAWLVNWELVILGINSSYVGGNGNDEYDNYKDLEKSNGGYYIDAYPASKYSIKSALNEITDNGNKDAYNILVGFETGSGSDGALYGHVVFIHGIIDGTVYFCESFNATVGGTYYPEGSVIACSIDSFAGYYDSWTTLDGLIHFQKEKGYISKCTIYPSYCNLKIDGAENLYTEPSTSSDVTGVKLSKGQAVTSLALVLNTADNYWYKIRTASGDEGYIFAGNAVYNGYVDGKADLTVSNQSYPKEIDQYQGYGLEGIVKTQYNSIYSTGVQVYQGSASSGTAVTGKIVTLDASGENNVKSYDLSGEVNDNTHFYGMDPGNYSYVVKSKYTGFYSNDGKNKTQYISDNVISTHEQFTVKSNDTTYITLTFSPNGGSCATTSLSVAKNAAVGSLPEPSLTGYRFSGWYTSPYGGSKVTSSTVATADMTLYAHWQRATDKLYFSNGNAQYDPVVVGSLDRVNEPRGGAELVVYNQNASSSWTNEYGSEVAVNSRGKVVAYRAYGDAERLAIPSGGFILSGQYAWDSNTSSSYGGYAVVNAINELEEAYVSVDYATGTIKAYDSYDAYLVNESYAADNAVYKELPVPTREDCLFEGWFSSNGVRAVYGESVHSTDLYASWLAGSIGGSVASTSYGGHTYELFDSPMSWAEAKAFCESRGGHLVSITSQGEQNAVFNLIQQGDYGVYYIGCTDEENEGSWKWITGESFSYNNWDPDYPEPDGAATLNYGLLVNKTNPPNKEPGEWMSTANKYRGGFYDASNTGFVCEYDSKPNITISFDANMGTGAPGSISAEAGTVIQIPETVPARFGYTFLYWDTISGGNAYTVEPGDIFEVNNDVTFCAVWREAHQITDDVTLYSASVDFPNQEIWYSINPCYSYEQNMVFDSLGNVDSLIYLYDEYGNLLAADDDSGDDISFRLRYQFVGASDKIFYIMVRLYSNNTGAIHFEAYRGYELTYDANGGTGAPNSQLFAEGGGVIVSEMVPSRDGYVFLGWSTSAQSAVAEVEAGGYIVGINGDFTLYAVWGNENCSVGNHEYERHVTPSTCTEQGYDMFICSVCGDSYQGEKYPALKHSWIESTSCSRCGTQARTIVPKEEQTITIAEAGEITYFVYTPTYKDLYAFQSYSDEKTYACIYDSEWNELASTDEGYEETDFYITHVLEAGKTYILGVGYCDAETATGTFSVMLQALHISNSTDGVVTKPATCTEDGIMTYNCTNCGTPFTAIIPGGHSWNDANICAVCGVAWYTEGTLCENITWILDSNYTLTISGTGEMDYDFFNFPPPWYSFIDRIQHIIIDNGVTTIAQHAFEQYYNNFSIEIADTVTSIGSYAFLNNEALTEIVIPSSVKVLGDGVFANCTNLNIVYFQGNSPEIGEDIFKSVCATAYYPSNNPTWTEEIIQQYAGEITWIAMYTDCMKGDHSFSNYVSDNNATCLKDGTKTASCDYGCGTKDTITAKGSMNPDAHSFDAWVTEGNKKQRICMLCGYAQNNITTDGGNVNIESSERPGLNFTVDHVEPSEDEYLLVEEALDNVDGADCDILKVFDITLQNADGVHVQPNGMVRVKLPLDIEEGSYKVYRVNDDGTLTDMNAYQQGSHVVFETDHFSLYVIVEEMEHKHDYQKTVTAPTCTEKGYATYICTCGDKYTADEVAALGHNEVTDKGYAATCTKKGLTNGVHCDRCDTVLTAQTTIAALGHSWDDGKVTTEPTEEMTGIRTYTCETCGETETENIPSLDHTHSYTSVVTAPTCTEKGYTTHTCTCGDSYVADYVDATGHAYESGICSSCGAADPDYVPDAELFELAGANMLLDNSLAMNFYIDPADLDEGEDYYAVVTMDYADDHEDLKITIDDDSWTEKYGMFCVTMDKIAAKEMADEITVVIYNDENKAVSVVWEDSVRAYAMRMLDKDTNKDNLAMYVDMLNYGAAAQEHFKYNASDLANNQMTAEQKAYGLAKVEMTDSRVAGTGYYGTSLTLESNILLNFFFDNIPADHEDMYAVATYTDHYGNAKRIKITGKDFAQYNASTWKVSVSGLVVADCRELVTVKVYDASGAVIASAVDSIESYTARMTDDGPLFIAIMKFAVSAYNAFH